MLKEQGKLIIVLSLLTIFSILVTGCYEMEGGITISEDGYGTARVEITADETMAGDDARGAAYQIDLL